MIPFHLERQKKKERSGLNALTFSKLIGDGEYSSVMECIDEQGAKMYALKKVRTIIIPEN
jgi:hypothetical protein